MTKTDASGQHAGLSRSRRILAAAVLVSVVIPSASTRAEPLLTPNHMAVVDGKPRFLLGLYQNPKDDAVLKEAVDAGFNVVRSSPTKAALDRLAAHGAKAWINLGGHLDLSRDAQARKARLLETVAALKDHPALLIWEGPDEALWNTWYAGHIRYFSGTEFRAMSAAARDSGKAELARLASRCQELFARSSWKEFDAKRAEFWRRADKKPPRPDATMADRVEASRRVGDGLTAGIRAVRQADPSHLIWLNHAPRNNIAAMRYHNREADMAGCDIYPVPAKRAQDHSDLVTNWMTCVGLYTDRMRAAAPGKACVMVLQGFGWRDIHEPLQKFDEDTDIGRRPTYRESRFMAFEAIAHGANAIMYWGTSSIESDSALWKGLLRLARVISALDEALVAPSVTPGPTAVSDENYGSTDGGGIVVMLKRAGNDHVLIAVNETPHGLPFTISKLPAGLEGKTLHRLWTEETVVVKEGSFRDGIRGFDVHVYATSRRFEPNRGK